MGEGAGPAAPGKDEATNDNAETVYISSLALLKVSFAGLLLEPVGPLYPLPDGFRGMR